MAHTKVNFPHSLVLAFGRYQLRCYRISITFNMHKGEYYLNSETRISILCKNQNHFWTERGMKNYKFLISYEVLVIKLGSYNLPEICNTTAQKPDKESKLRTEK